MLYGDHNIYGGDSPYQPTELQLGTEPIVCESFTYDPATATISVYGQNFTTYSDILVDGERKNAVFRRRDAPHRPRQRRDGRQPRARGPVHPARATSWGARDLEKCVKFRRNALYFRAARV